MSLEQAGFDRLLVVVNPNSTQYDRVHNEVLARLDDSSWANRYAMAKTEDPLLKGANNVELIGELLVPNQAILIAGGDGLVNDVVNSADQADDDVRLSTFHVPLPYGDGNDSARSFYGKARGMDPVSLLELGEEQDVDLIDVLVGGQSRVAVGYAGIGWTALGANAINQPDKRLQKKDSALPNKVLDGITLAQLIVAQHFRPSFAYREGGDYRVKEAGEMLFANLTNVAGGVIKVEQSKPGKVICVEIGPEHFVSDVARKLGSQNFIGGMHGKQLSSRSITVKSDTMIQFDGEAVPLSAGKKVTVSVKKSRIKGLVLPRQD